MGQATKRDRALVAGHLIFPQGSDAPLPEDRDRADPAFSRQLRKGRMRRACSPKTRSRSALSPAPAMCRRYRQGGLGARSRHTRYLLGDIGVCGMECSVRQRVSHAESRSPGNARLNK